MIKNIILTVFSFLLLQSSVFAEVVKFIQVTDTHFKSNDEYRTEVLENTIKSINKEKDVSFVVFTGDNIDNARIDYLQDFLKIINRLKLPYYIVIGNHDAYKNNGLSKKRYFEIVRENHLTFIYRKPSYSFKKNGFTFLVVDGAKEVIPGPNGYFKEDTLKWLDKQLSKNNNKNVIIFQHFPLVALKDVKSHRVYEKEKYFDVLDKHDNVVSIVTGHLHTNSEIMRNGVYHIVTPSLLNNPHYYKIISVSTTKGFSPMVYTELKEVDMSK